MFLDNILEDRLLIALNMLSDINSISTTYKLKSVNFEDDKVVFTNNNGVEETKSLKDMLSRIEEKIVSDVKNIENKMLQSDTTLNLTTETEKLTEMTEKPEQLELQQQSEQSVKSQKMEQKQSGGSSKIFKSSKFSDTSSVRYSENLNFSQTSSINKTFSSDLYSDTSAIALDSKLVGGNGNLETSDTLRSISDIKGRKNKNNQMSNLDLGIFKKVQSGGSASTLPNNDIKKKMLEVGINSSSTSSVCE
jgi:hypothetical protein